MERKEDANWVKRCAIVIGGCEIIMKEKTFLSYEVVCFQMLDFETSNSKSEVSKSDSWTITSFSKTVSLQREPFLTMFYTTCWPTAHQDVLRAAWPQYKERN